MHYSPGPFLPDEVGSGVATCLRLWTLPHCRGGLRHRHVSIGSGHRLPAEVGFGAGMCPEALGLATQSEMPPTLPHVLRLRISPPCRGGLRRCHASCGFLWAGGLMYKKDIVDLPMRLGSCVSKVRSCVSKVPNAQAIAACKT
jgi:hypothetical protein